MSDRVGMSALALAFPATVRSNEYWHEHHPDLVQTASEQALAKLWSRQGGADGESLFERAMAPYASDPFKGARERRVLGPGEGALDLEADALAKVLAASGYEPGDIDLVIVSAMRPDALIVGDAAYLVQRAGLRCPAINLETACSSSVMGLDLACALVETGRHRRIAVVVACTYSREVDVDNTLAWFLADGAGAFIVEAGPRTSRPLGRKSITTAQTCGAFLYEPRITNGEVEIHMRATKQAGRVLHDTAEPYVRACCLGAADSAGLKLEDIDFFVFNTPTAWYADFCADTLGVSRERTISTYPIYTNIGLALMPANLHAAATQGRIAPGDRVLLYAVGSTSTAMAVIIEWGEVALGPTP